MSWRKPPPRRMPGAGRGMPNPDPTTFRTISSDGEPVHHAWAVGSWITAPCGAKTTFEYREVDRDCPPVATCRTCVAWLEANPPALPL